MKIKGYIKNLDVDREIIDVAQLGGITESVPGKTTVSATIVFVEGNLNFLLKSMNNNDPIELDFEMNSNKIKDFKKPGWRLIEGI